MADDEDSSNAIDLLDWKTSIGHLVRYDEIECIEDVILICHLVICFLYACLIRLTPVDAKEFEVEEV